jgi:hypothetical protein
MSTGDLLRVGLTEKLLAQVLACRVNAMQASASKASRPTGLQF